MAIYHLSVKTISRSTGRSATTAAAYRAGVEIADERTGEVHDYRRKGGIESAELVLPAGAPEWAADRAALWNAAEQAEKRKNSTVAREFEIALPAELSPDERQRLALDFARELVERHRCAADVAIHAPGKGGDNHNHHAHILLTTRRLTPAGFSEKTRELDDRKTKEIDGWRERFASLQNERLCENGLEARVDHRSHAERGIETVPTLHLGPGATGYERRTGELSETRMRQEANADRLVLGREVGELERQAQATERAILDLSGGLEAAQRERDRQSQPEAKQTAANRLEALPMADQVKAWEAALKKAHVAREQRLARVSQKAHDRYQRRYQAAEQLRRDQPEAPSGLLAAFKQRVYQEATATWRQSFTRAGMLEQQAAALCSQVVQAWAKAKSWAYDKLSQAHPELAKRVKDHQQAERRKKIEQQQREREAKRVQQKGRYRGR
ncbi:MobQ family relaxase [Malikia spinosa]|uniref:MobQ family relaxase n=1 Tax=Malikia spinosa TaxID=86180 RepID=UPI001B80E0DC|nr:MobQ family relaxase [Malikia spinosa]